MNKRIFKGRIFVFPIIFLIGGLFILSGDLGIIRWYQLYNKRNLIQENIEFLQLKEIELNNELDRLKNDQNYIKEIDQKKFHMVQKDEKVFRVKNK